MKKISTYIAYSSPVVQERMLEIIGMFDVVEVIGTAGNGIDALTEIQMLLPDVVVLDINMQGLEVLTKIKASNPSIKVVFFSGYSDTDIGKEIRLRGADFCFHSNNVDAFLDFFQRMQETAQNNNITGSMIDDNSEGACKVIRDS